MFAPDAPQSTHGHSLRPKRSRRAGSDDSIKLPRAKRRRSALRKDTFEPLSALSPNEVAISANGNIAPNKILGQEETENQDDQIPPTKELTLRAAKKTEKRSGRSNGTMILSGNDFYTVEQLPALPGQIRSRPTVPYSSSIFSDYGYALALTHSEALIWNYHSSSSTPSAKDLFSFKLSLPPAAENDPLPLAVFAARSVGSEPGLVVVSPNKGIIVYWETITYASSLLPGHTSTGLQGSVPGMFSGETVKDLISAEPAGFILTLSHGRVAHLTVKDQLGRPAIGVQFLRKSNISHHGGFFGSIRNFVGGDRRRPVAAVRAGRATKGQRDVVIATEEGDIEHWNTQLNVVDSLNLELSLKEEISEALKHTLPDEAQDDLHFKVLDFVLAESSTTGHELAQANSHLSSSMFLLVSLADGDGARFHIVEAHVSPQSSSIDVVHTINCYTAPAFESPRWKPRLCIPKHGQVAFVIFETAVVIFSLARVKESPSSQLVMEGQGLPEPFQDCIKFQNDTVYRVLGFASGDKKPQPQNPSCVLAVQGFGIVRVTSTVPPNSDEEPEEIQITLKSKLEQAIFYGTNRQNPLDLSNTDRTKYSIEEVEEAALAISHEMLSSSSKYVAKASPSVDQHLKQRAKALKDLALHLQKHHGPLSRVLKWRLLWNAEKMAAAQAMWKVQEDIMKRKPKDRNETYWEQLLFFMGDEYRTKLDKEKGEHDWVRLWLTKDVFQAHYLLNWLVEGHKEVKEDNFLSENERIENIRESSDLWIAGVGAAYRFREDNAPLYGLGDEIFDPQHSILKSGYKDLPESWTIEARTVRGGENLLELVAETTRDEWEPSKIGDSGKTSRKTVVHMAHVLPKEVDLYLRMFTERYNWLMEQDHEEHPKYLDQARKMLNWGVGKRRQHLYTIAGLGLVQEAIAVAEHWRDMKALVELNMEAKKQVIERAQNDLSLRGAREVEQGMKKIDDRTESYFDKYGMDWARAYFSMMVVEGQLGSLLVEGQTDETKQPYLTQYLRKHSGFGKISWINDVICEKDFGHAATTLEYLGLKKVDDLWTKKTGLCLAKLSRLAAVEPDSKGTTRKPRVSTKRFDDRLALLDLQTRLCDHILPTIGPVIDAAGAQQVALESFGKRVVGDKKYPALKALLNDGLGVLLRDKALPAERLIDVLTLMDFVEYGGPEVEDPQILGHEFWLALQVLQLGEVDTSAGDGLSHIIWRRAITRDDWVLLNDTTDKDDQQVTEAMTQSSLYRTLLDYFEHNRQHGDQAGNVKLFSPSQILDAEVFPKPLQKRFREDEIELVKHDLEAENEVLRRCVEKGRVELHYGGLLKMAQAEVRAEADRAGEEAAKEVSTMR